MDYKSDFEADNKRGKLGENLLAEIADAYLRRGEHAVEVKTDSRVSETKKVYLESESRDKTSGIAQTDAKYVAIVLDGAQYNREVIIIILTSRLRQIINNSGWHGVPGGDNDTSLGDTLKPEELVGRIPPPRLFRTSDDDVDRGADSGSFILAELQDRRKEA